MGRMSSTSIGEFVRQLVEIVASAAIDQQFHEAGNAAGTRVRQHLELGALARTAIARSALAGGGQVLFRLGQDLIDVVDEGDKARRLAVAILRNIDFEVGTDASRIAAEHDDAIGQQHRFFNVVGDDEDAQRRHLLVEPEFQQLGAQVLSRENVERGERLVHEQDFRLDHQRARKADTLLHAAGELFGIGSLEAVKAHGVDHAQGALVTLDCARASGSQRRFDVLQHGEPGEEREALKDDGDVRDLACASACRAISLRPTTGAESPVSMRSSVDLPEPDGPSSATILPG